MKVITTAVFVTSMAVTAWAPSVLSQQAVAKAAPVEAFYCDLQPGKTMKDLMQVSKRFSSWADKHDQGYAAWVLTPQFAQFSETPQVLWLGSNQTGNDMGKGLDAWQASGADVQKDFDRVMACGSHVLASSVEINAPDGPPGDGVVMFTPCSFAEDSDWYKAVDAHKTYSAAMRDLGAKNSNWIFFPMLGGTADRDFDYWGVSTFASWTDYFAAYELYVNGGGWKKGMDALSGAVECALGAASVWDVTQVREASR